MRIERAKTAAMCIAGVILFSMLLALFAGSLTEGIRKSRPEQTAEAVVYAAGVQGYEEFFGAPEAPAEGVGRTETERTVSADVLDYTSGVIWGWDGRYCELWEMDLFARIFYLEFWGASPECCEAGCDAMLNLWASGLYGRTLGESLSAVNDFGAYVYSVYPNVWTANYDPDGLAWCREFCESRFCEGPKWEAMYFQLYGFHDPSWAIPLYEIDGVYFSVAR